MKRRDFLSANLAILPYLRRRGTASVPGMLFPNRDPTQNDPNASRGRGKDSQQALRWENDSLAFRVLPVDGSLAEIENKRTGEVHRVTSTPFIILTDRGEIAAASSRLVSQRFEATSAEFLFEHGALRVRMRYELLANRHFFEKTLTLENTSSEPVLIEDLMVERLRFVPAFLQTSRHYDGSVWECPINVFLRTKKGGLFIGVENPYFDMLTPGAWKATRLDLHYSPRWKLHPGESFASEPSFVGVYKREHIYCFKEMEPFANIAPPQVILDWGEVWAMQDFMCAIQPHYELPYPGYYLRANGVDFFTDLGRSNPAHAKPSGQPSSYWIEHSQCAFEAPMVVPAKMFVDRVATQGHVKSIDWGTIWFGNAGWLRESPGEYLETLPESWPIKPNPYWADLVEYAREKDLGVGIMDEGGARDYLKHEDQWKLLTKEGTPVRGTAQLEGFMGRNCWANPAFAAWWVEIVSRAIERYDVPIWGTDSGSIWWVPFDPPLECYSTHHTHPVGECTFYAWRNIMWASGELRRRHPNCALRNAGGMHRGYPWVLRDWIEYHPYLDPVPMGPGGNVTDNIRFQSWNSYNFRFIPIYKTGSEIRTDDRYTMGYGMFSNLTRGDHGMAAMVPPLRVRDAKEGEVHLAFYRKWTDWAMRNVRYFRVRRDILGEPRLTGLDGCAHCLEGNGFVFVFNPTTSVRGARIPLNHWIGLTASENFEVKELYPSEGISYGTYERGEEAVVLVEPHDCLVLQINTISQYKSRNRPNIPPNTPVDKAFLNAVEVRKRLKMRLSIPSE